MAGARVLAMSAALLTAGTVAWVPPLHAAGDAGMSGTTAAPSGSSGWSGHPGHPGRPGYGGAAPHYPAPAGPGMAGRGQGEVVLMLPPIDTQANSGITYAPPPPRSSIVDGKPSRKGAASEFSTRRADGRSDAP